MEKNHNDKVVVTVHVEDDKSVSIVEENVTLESQIATPKLVAKRYEFQSLLGADLSSSTSSLLMAPPKCM
jgi:hypothetical protein